MNDNEVIVSIRLNEDLVRKLEKACITRKASMDNLVSELIDKYL